MGGNYPCKETSNEVYEFYEVYELGNRWYFYIYTVYLTTTHS